MEPEAGDLNVSVTREEIPAAARAVGIVESDVVFSHSSLSSRDCVVGGPKALIDGLLEAVGPTSPIPGLRLIASHT